MAPSSRLADNGQTANIYTTALEPLLYENWTRHFAPTGTRFATMVVNSVALLAMPPHVGE
jgi:hypothetical protein